MLLERRDDVVELESKFFPKTFDWKDVHDEEEKHDKQRKTIQ